MILKTNFLEDIKMIAIISENKSLIQRIVNTSKNYFNYQDQLIKFIVFPSLVEFLSAKNKEKKLVITGDSSDDFKGVEIATVIRKLQPESIIMHILNNDQGHNVSSIIAGGVDICLKDDTYFEIQFGRSLRSLYNGGILQLGMNKN